VIYTQHLMCDGIAT